MKRFLPIAMAAPLVAASGVSAQRIARDEYLSNIPLEYPTLVRQTDASRDVALFGDRTKAGYRDVAPVDGIDDGRRRVLETLAVRFAPYLVMNSTLLPMDVRRFMEGDEPFPLYVDHWDVSRSEAVLVESEEIPWQRLSQPVCTERSPADRPDTPDCKLLSLLERFDPIAPGPAYGGGSVAADTEPFEVVFYDLPGHDEETWKEEFVNAFNGRLPRAYGDFVKTFVHPFVEYERSRRTGARGYRLVLQYWFYYPFNDGAMNHEGDWEHINVYLAPLSDLEEPLDRAALDRVLSGAGPSDSAADRLVIQKVDYYFHHFVMTLDYTRPNVYQPRDAWESEVAHTMQERRGEAWLWLQTRDNAWADDAETVVNTHPIGYIGADNKGNDQLLKAPGGSNRDSHGTYPFPAIYKDVGPGGAAERIQQRFDHRRWLAEGGDREPVPAEGFGRGSVVAFASSDRVEIVPDGERVLDLVKEDAEARRQWAWLVLPVRWGYPATASPFAWLVKHTDLGNGAPIGPSYNSAWNRSGDAPGYEPYAPHRFGSLFPLSWQDGFRNDLGYLNFIGPTLVVLPPLDLVWRVASAPFRHLFGTQDPIFQTDEHIPYRVLSVAANSSYVGLDVNFVNLLKNEDQLESIGERLATALTGADSIVGAESEFVRNTTMMGGQVSLYLGERLAGENTIRHARSTLGVSIDLPTIGDVFTLQGELNLWEYTGSLRYNLSGGSFMPFVVGGYGWTWYRVENVGTDGVPLAVPNGPWVDRPTLRHPSSLLPNSWHAGVGIEWVPLRSFAPLPRGVDFGVRGSAVVNRHALGLGLDTVIRTSQGLNIDAGPERSPVVWRPVYSLGLTVSF